LLFYCYVPSCSNQCPVNFYFLPPTCPSSGALAKSFFCILHPPSPLSSSNYRQVDSATSSSPKPLRCPPQTHARRCRFFLVNGLGIYLFLFRVVLLSDYVSPLSPFFLDHKRLVFSRRGIVFSRRSRWLLDGGRSSSVCWLAEPSVNKLCPSQNPLFLPNAPFFFLFFLHSCAKSSSTKVRHPPLQNPSHRGYRPAFFS